jgi:hypothetical protein
MARARRRSHRHAWSLPGLAAPQPTRPGRSAGGDWRRSCEGRGRPPIKGAPEVVRFHQGSQSRLAGATASVSGTAEPTVSSRSPAARLFGIAAACRRCRSVDFSCAIAKASSSRRLRRHRQSTPVPATSSPGSSVDGRSRCICRGSRSSGRSNPAPVVRQSDPSHVAGPARLALDHHALGERPHQITKAQAENLLGIQKQS